MSENVILLKKLLLNASLFSIEYSGILSFKFSICSNSIYYNEIDLIIIEFISGCKIFDRGTNVDIDNNTLFNLVALEITDIKLFNDNFLEIFIDEKYIIKALDDNFNLNDRKWVIKDELNELNITFDGFELVSRGLIK